MPFTPAAHQDDSSVEQQALKALSYLDDNARQKVLEYIESLVKLEQANYDKGSIRED